MRMGILLNEEKLTLKSVSSLMHGLVRKTDNTNVSDTIASNLLTLPFVSQAYEIVFSIVIRKFIGFSEFGEISWR